MVTKLNPEVIQTGSITADKLDTAVQTSLGKADTALQSYTEQYKGTVTGVKVNGTTKSPSSGIIDLGTVITAHQTLKTINGQTIVGNGDITISGGSDANVQAVDTGDVIDDVNVDYATKTYVDGLIGDINSVLESIISGGGSQIIFPIYLVEGDNGNVGIQFYNFLEENGASDDPVWGYTLKEDEIVYMDDERLGLFTKMNGADYWEFSYDGEPCSINSTGQIYI